VFNDEEIVNMAARCDTRRERLCVGFGTSKINRPCYILTVMPMLSSEYIDRSTSVDSTFIVCVSACVCGDFVGSSMYAYRQGGKISGVGGSKEAGIKYSLQKLDEMRLIWFGNPGGGGGVAVAGRWFAEYF
jgi:hypothetical protein